MVLVCLAHTNRNFATSSPELFQALTYVARIAVPTFLLLSGFIAGHLLQDAHGRARMAFVDRALFLLIVAHLLIGLAELPELGLVNWLFARSVITDAIGAALLMGVLLRGASAGALAAIGFTMFLASWCIATYAHPQSESAQMLAAVLFDLPTPVATQIDAPLIPYMGVFLLGMALSKCLQKELLANARIAAARRLAPLAVIAISAGLAVWYIGKHLPSPVYLLSKRPPAPAYLLLFGGLGLLMLSAFLRGQPAWLLSPIIRIASTIGRASLMCFVLQDWLLFVVPWAFGFSDATSVTFWLAYLAVSLVILYGVSRWWGSVDGNRFLTIGLRKKMLPAVHHR